MSNTTTYSSIINSDDTQALIRSYQQALRSYLIKLTAKLHGYQLPAVPADFAAVMSDTSDNSTLRRLLDDELTQAKAYADHIVQHIEENAVFLNTAYAHYPKLFPDLQQLILMKRDQLLRLIDYRIRQHQQQGIQLGHSQLILAQNDTYQDSVTVPKAEYQQLRKQHRLIKKLYEEGLEQWPGYTRAINHMDAFV